MTAPIAASAHLDPLRSCSRCLQPLAPNAIAYSVSYGYWWQMRDQPPHNGCFMHACCAACLWKWASILIDTNQWPGYLLLAEPTNIHEMRTAMLDAKASDAQWPTK